MTFRRQLGSPIDSLALVARVLALSAQPGPDRLAAGLAQEAAGLLNLSGAALLELAGGDDSLRIAPADGGPVRTAPVPVALREGALRPLLLRNGPLSTQLGGGPCHLLLPLPAGAATSLDAYADADADADAPRRLLALAGTEEELLDATTRKLAEAFAEAAAAAFGHQATGLEHRRAADQHAALARAAKTLNESPDLATLLTRICQEAASVVGADAAVVYRVVEEGELAVEAEFGMPPEHVGFRMPAGQGLAGRVLEADEPRLTEDYQRVAAPEPGSPWHGVRGAMAVPVRWGGELRGVLSVAYWQPTRLSRGHLEALETFAELAAVAFQNASTHAGLAEAARTDPLTGCLNHAALHDGLAREIERAERSGATELSLVLLDLDRFKQINDTHGHVVGDEVLRRVGHALRSTTRPYDLAARYGGDEFALVVVGAAEEQAYEIAVRTVERIALNIGDLAESGGASATAGVADWQPGLTPGDLIARADRALLYGKRADRRGEVLRADDLPDTFLMGRGQRRNRPLHAPTVVSGPAWRPPSSDDAAERLRQRTRQLALANQLGARLAAMTDVRAIHDAVVEELHEAFGYFMCAVVRIRPDGMVESAAGCGEAFVRLGLADWHQPVGHGLIGRCLTTGRPVRSDDVTLEPDYGPTAETLEVRSEAVVPLRVDGDLWGVINVEEIRPAAFDDDDVRLLQTVADQAGAAMRSAFLYAELERAYRAALEATRSTP